jgi:hypothetical protein
MSETLKRELGCQLSGSGLIGEISEKSMIEVVEEKVNGTTTTDPEGHRDVTLGRSGTITEYPH